MQAAVAAPERINPTPAITIEEIDAAPPYVSRPLVIYHGNCADGFTAAWAIWRRFRDGADYFAATHQDPPPDVTGRDVVLVDFSYKPDVMRVMSQFARSILVLDHHKSAGEDLAAEPRTGLEFLTVCRWHPQLQREGRVSWESFQAQVHHDQFEGIGRAIVYAIIDQERSGAGLTWDFFHPGVPRPELVNHVEDRDLWRFVLPGTREIQAAVFSHAYSFDTWERLASTPTSTLYSEGFAIERKHRKDVAELVAVCRRRMPIAGHNVWVASLPYTLTSDAGHLMAVDEPFAACYWDTADGRVFSLRSTVEGMDVSAIARQYGGGGHRDAAGFRVPRDHELARS